MLHSCGLFLVMMAALFRFFLCCCLLVSAVRVGIAEEEPVRFRDPARAMYQRRFQPVSVKIRPEWKLTEAQKKMALQAPRRKSGTRTPRYVYPEDEQATPEQLADGSALTERQRRLLRKARVRALEEACWNAFTEAQAYNQKHDAEITRQEKQGRYLSLHLGTQKGAYMEREKVLLSFSFCSGKRSTPTPTGHFHIMEKNREHRSNLHNNADMPYFMRLTLGGIGLHQGPVRSRPSSHGCIRLSRKTAEYLFENCPVGTPVFIRP